jgi:putative ABC transport system permease protein
MLSPRWKKVLTDIIANKTRTALVVLSIAVGVFAVGMILGTQVILSRDLPGTFSQINPGTAEIYTEGFDDEFVASMRHVPGVGDAQGIASITVRAKIGSNTRTIALMQTDGKERRINKVWPQTGVWPPALHEITLERASLDYLGLKVGDTITVDDVNGKTRQLRISGSAHYLNLPPPMFVGQGYGFATFDTIEWLGGSRQYSALALTMATDPLDPTHISDVASAVRNRVENSGRKVFFTYLPTPAGHYPAEDGITVILMLLAVLGVLALGLSGFLVINTVSALVTQQTRQIGVMKAVGGRRNQVITMNLSTVLGYGTLALLVGIPLGSLGAIGFSSYMATICNFDIQSFVPPLYVIAVEFLVGLGVPVLAGIYPVYHGTSITVREALTPAGSAGSSEGNGLVDRLVGSIRGLNRPLLISLRNTFRRKGRLALTISTLILGGAIFIAVVSVRESTALTLDDALAYFNYDIEVSMKQAYKSDRLVSEVRRVPGVADADIVNGETGRRVRPDGKESNNLTVLALPANSPLVKPTLLEGRWLLPEDENAVVLNTIFLKDEPDLKVGSDIVIKLDGKDQTWKVVGIVRGVMTGSIAYANRPYFWRVTDNPGRSSTLWVVTDKHDAASQDAAAKAIEKQLKANGTQVSQTQTISFLRVMIQSQFDIIVVFLMVMAVLLAVVGGLGLMGTMSLNVIERTREIGVMRATGASNGMVRQIFIVEALLIGVLSWAVGAVIALPVSRLLSDGVGMAFLQSPLSFSYSTIGVGIWLVLVVIISTLASILPARSASRLTVREVLAYE